MKRQIKTIMLLIAGLSILSSVQAQDTLQFSYEEIAVDTVIVVEDSLVADEQILVEELVVTDSAVTATPVQEPQSQEEKAPKTYCPHEIGVWLSGGVSELLYSSSFGNESLGWGGAFGVGYTWFFHKNWGVGLGAELALYQGQIRIDGLTDTYQTQDQDGHDIHYSARFDNYKEYQYLGNVNIPLNIMFQTNMRGNNKFYTSLAFKLGVPIWSQYSSKSAELTTWGYYPHVNQTLTQQQDLGYGNFKGINTKGTIPFDLSYMGQIEMGFKWHVAPGRDLYTGVYAEYAFNDVVKGAPEDRFIAYNSENPSAFLSNGVLTSEYRRYGTSSAFTDKVALLGVGIKLKLGFSVGCSELLAAERVAKEPQQEPLPEPVNPNLEIARQYAEAARAAAEQARIEAERARQERDAYLRDAEARRANFERNVVRPNRHLEMDNYNLAIVTLNPVQKSELDVYIAQLQSDENTTVRITGHTCDLGSEELNMRIGQERADLAKDYMVENGISPGRITTFSEGESSPIFPNNNAVNRKKNRRLEIEIR
ncbi:MAG: OmpA family protein [Prevotellaceae bacterium]|nr:OmpA family protein [Prevotellaceae bacterium]